MKVVILVSNFHKSARVIYIVYFCWYIKKGRVRASIWLIFSFKQHAHWSFGWKFQKCTTL